jgi:ABC-type transport system involved in Fe-S cluster assembly fused permease/ATPase subunit
MKHEFNLISLLVLVGVLVFGLLFIWFFSWREQKRIKREESKYPSATAKRYSKEVDRLLEFDDTEKFYHN